MREEIQHILATAPPGATIAVVFVAVPPAPIETRADANGEATAEWSPEQIASWVAQEYGEAGLKLRDWAALLPMLSVRELKRAVQEGHVVWHSKPDGKDHGATMISPDALLEYLAARSGDGEPVCEETE